MKNNLKENNIPKVITISEIGNKKDSANKSAILELYGLIKDEYENMVVEYTQIKKQCKYLSKKGSEKQVTITRKYDVKLDNRDLCSVYYIDKNHHLLVLENLFFDTDEERGENSELIESLAETVIQRKYQQDKDNANKQQELTEQQKLAKQLEQNPLLKFVNSFRTKNK